ncbi:MAG: hypothetical protein A3E01_07085 [Gammaproteobacteria bacterium RIFCSPHIGHO2_12_FULL_63_22]|nr:MAG: hypothetical protein A3E01_07085 [Gammaproteobacteria bacterium RIFCSPHIGHO2_12_FULL_63_22]
MQVTVWLAPTEVGTHQQIPHFAPAPLLTTAVCHVLPLLSLKVSVVLLVSSHVTEAISSCPDDEVNDDDVTVSVLASAPE